VPTRLDPTVAYDRLPIELGEIAGVRTRIQIVAVPGAAEHAPTRKALLDRVNGVVFVVDAERGRIDDNVASFEELRGALAAYGRSLEDVPLVVQYNKQDLADPYVLEELHRKLDVRGAAVFEAVAHEGTGVLPTLTTISKRVVRTLRENAAARAPQPAPAPPPARSAAAPAAKRPLAPPPPTIPLEHAALAAGDEPDSRDTAVHRAAGLLDAPWPEVAAQFAPDAEAVSAAAARSSGPWRLIAAGHPQIRPPGGLVVPLVLADADGREVRFRLALSLDLLLDD
jgi:signal recognition particle receptor subunit beta